MDTAEGLSKQPQLPRQLQPHEGTCRGRLAPGALLATWGSRGDLQGTRGDCPLPGAPCGAQRNPGAVARLLLSSKAHYQPQNTGLASPPSRPSRVCVVHSA